MDDKRLNDSEFTVGISSVPRFEYEKAGCKMSNAIDHCLPKMRLWNYSNDHLLLFEYNPQEDNKI